MAQIMQGRRLGRSRRRSTWRQYPHRHRQHRLPARPRYRQVPFHTNTHVFVLERARESERERETHTHTHTYTHIYRVGAAADA